MTKEEAFVGLRVKYTVLPQVRDRGRKDGATHYGTIVLLKEKECIVKFKPFVERPCLYEKLEPVV